MFEFVRKCVVLFLTEKLEKFFFLVSAAEGYLSCPLGAFLQKLLRNIQA